MHDFICRIQSMKNPALSVVVVGRAGVHRNESRTESHRTKSHGQKQKLKKSQEKKCQNGFEF